MKRVVSAIKPTGELHIGNYIGTISNWVELQKDSEAFIFIADYHALTINIEPEKLTSNTYHILAMLIALGIDPKTTTLFLQSSVPSQTELAWILNNFVSIGQLQRMTQFKEKSSKNSQNAGLFTYPVLMTADVAAYQATHVPVGDDQIQHLELSREIIRSFNKKVGDQVLVEPQPILSKHPRLMSLNNPDIKMSKSIPGSAIGLLDSDDQIAKTIRRAVTDSDTNSAALSPAMTNLMAILEAVSEPGVVNSCLKDYKNNKLSYSEFKELLTEEVITFLKPIKKAYHSLMTHPDELDKILKKGNAKANQVSRSVLSEVKKSLGVIGAVSLD